MRTINYTTDLTTTYTTYIDKEIISDSPQLTKIQVITNEFSQ